MTDEGPELRIAIRTDETSVEVELAYEDGDAIVVISLPNTGQVDQDEVMSLLQTAPSVFAYAIDALEAQQ